tara:strand:- start:1599 stop:2123 length:525 start_codon:yes stop_codon:yes gene_type:complete
MLTLRCTKKLMKYLDTGPTSQPPHLTTTLGDWYANLFRYDQVDIAMCVNQKTRYAIPVPLYDCPNAHSLYVLLTRRIRKTVLRLGFTDTVANQIDQEYTGYLVAPTSDRSVIGTMNDLIDLCEYMIDDECNSARAFDFNTAWLKFEDELNQTPHKPLGGDNSRKRILELLQGMG